MKACVYLGPTLAAVDAAGLLEATWLPPAKQGDVYRAVSLLRPRAIGLVDGYFRSVPSVWHKEILWAMHQGVHVFGAASMGALRAAELAPFGMHGVGRIFEAFRDGALVHCKYEPFEDDDEVAVVHGPAELGYVAGSEAMVNIRCTLADAEAAGVIGAATRLRLVNIAKAMFFPERNYERLLEQARAAAVCASQLAALEAWLPAGRVNQKRADALAMLETMREFLAADPAPAAPRFEFEHTTLWDRALAQMRPATMHDPEELRVLAELRLDGARWDGQRRDALRSLMAPAPDEPATGLAPLAQRLADHRGQPHELERLFKEAAREETVRRAREQIPSALVERQMLARIRDTQEFARLLARAEDKQARIAARPDLPDVEEFSDLQLLELRDWYFTQVLRQDMPDDMEQCIHAWGYGDPADFHRAIFAEHIYRRMCRDDGATADAARGSG